MRGKDLHHTQAATAQLQWKHLLLTAYIITSALKLTAP